MICMGLLSGFDSARHIYQIVSGSCRVPSMRMPMLAYARHHHKTRHCRSGGLG